MADATGETREPPHLFLTETPEHKMPDQNAFHNEVKKRIVEIVLEVIKPLMKTPGKPLYHYTRYEGFTGMVAGQCIHATDIRFMNDAGETTYAHNTLNEIIDSKISAADEDYLKVFLAMLKNSLEYVSVYRLFAFCMSERDDDLSQWRAYAGQTHGHSSGYTIGFEWESSIIMPSIFFSNEAIDYPDLVLLNVIYDRSTQISIIESILEKVSHLYRSVILDRALGRPSEISNEIVRAEFLTNLCFGLYEIFLRFKNPVFQDESEWRLVYALHRLNSDEYKRNKIKYRSGPLGLTPYVQIMPFPRAGHLRGRLPITSVQQGPRSEPDIALGALREFMHIHGYSFPFINVRKSTVPIRF